MNEILLDKQPDENVRSKYSSYPKLLLDLIQRTVTVQKVSDYVYSWSVNKELLNEIENTDNSQNYKRSPKEYRLGILCNKLEAKTPVGKLIYERMMANEKLDKAMDNEIDTVNEIIEDIDRKTLLKFGTLCNDVKDSVVVKNVSANTPSCVNKGK